MQLRNCASLDYYGLMLQFTRIFTIRRLRALAIDFPLKQAAAHGLHVVSRSTLTTFLVLAATTLPPLGFAQPARPQAPANALAAEPSAPPSSALDGELFYQLLLGELNTYGGEAGAGYSLILDAARKTNDAKLYERAVTIALQSRSGESALLAARAWSKALPSSREANRYSLQILIGLNRIGETLEPLKSEITASPLRERAVMIGAIPRFYARASDKKLAAGVVEQALAEAMANPATGAAAWQARILSYPDAHRYRIGINYGALDVNKPQCPVNTYHRDGQTRFDSNGGGSVNYQPNSFSGPADDASFREPPLKISGDADRYNHREGNDDYHQAGDLYRLMNADQKSQLVNNLVGALQPVPLFIQVRQIGHFYKADADYGKRVAAGLGIAINEAIGQPA